MLASEYYIVQYNITYFEDPPQNPLFLRVTLKEVRCHINNVSRLSKSNKYFSWITSLSHIQRGMRFPYVITLVVRFLCHTLIREIIIWGKQSKTISHFTNKRISFFRFKEHTNILIPLYCLHAWVLIQQYSKFENGVCIAGNEDCSVYRCLKNVCRQCKSKNYVLPVMNVSTKGRGGRVVAHSAPDQKVVGSSATQIEIVVRSPHASIIAPGDGPGRIRTNHIVESKIEP